MRSAVAAAAIAGMLLGAPAQAAAPQAPAAGMVAAMNRAGFAEFAAAGADRLDVMVSPLLTWYVHAFLSLRSHDASARALVTRLRRSGVMIGATMRAARGRSGYTDIIASSARDDLGVTTLWDQSRGADYAWTAEAEMRTSDDFADKALAQLDDVSLRAPFYARDGIRAVRLDSADGSRSLFVFFGTRAILSELRRRMSVDLWQQLTGEFVPSDVLLSNFTLRQRKRVSISIAPNEGFGSFQRPGGSHDGDVDASISASLQRVDSRLHAAVQGYPSVDEPGVPHEAYRIVYADPATMISEDRRLSSTVPALYVLEDTQTGAIVLMGVNG